MVRTVLLVVVVALFLPRASLADPEPVTPTGADPAPVVPADAPAAAPVDAAESGSGSEAVNRDDVHAGDATPDPDEKTQKKLKKLAKKLKTKEANKRLRVSGFIQILYRHTFFTSTDGAVDAPDFRVQRARLAVDGELQPWLSYSVSIDPRAPDITGVLRDAYFTIKKVIPHHRIRIGQQKTQFGYENNVSSTKLWAVNRAELSDNLSRGVTLRDIGIGLVGGWPISPGLKLEDGSPSSTETG